MGIFSHSTLRNVVITSNFHRTHQSLSALSVMPDLIEHQESCWDGSLLNHKVINNKNN